MWCCQIIIQLKPKHKKHRHRDHHGPDHPGHQKLSKRAKYDDIIKGKCVFVSVL